jgi:hypothetical protein
MVKLSEAVKAAYDNTQPLLTPSMEGRLTTASIVSRQFLSQPL